MVDMLKRICNKSLRNQGVSEQIGKNLIPRLVLFILKQDVSDPLKEYRNYQVLQEEWLKGDIRFDVPAVYSHNTLTMPNLVWYPCKVLIFSIGFFSFFALIWKKYTIRNQRANSSHGANLPCHGLPKKHCVKLYCIIFSKELLMYRTLII